MAAIDCCYHRPKIIVYTACTVDGGQAARGGRVVQHGVFSPSLVLEYLFVFSKDKNYLPSGCLSQEAFKDDLGGGLQVFQCHGHRHGPKSVVGML